MLSREGVRDGEEFGASRASMSLLNWPKYSRTARIRLGNGAMLAGSWVLLVL